MTDATKTLRKLQACAEVWMPDARLVGNIRAKDVGEMCRKIEKLIEAAQNIVSIDEFIDTVNVEKLHSALTACGREARVALRALDEEPQATAKQDSPHE